MSVFTVHDPAAVVGRRVLAYVVDAVLNGIVIAMLAGSVFPEVALVPEPFTGRLGCPEMGERLGVCFENGDTFYEITNEDLVKVIVIPVGVSLANAVVLTGLTGASIGKFLLGIRVVNRRGRIAGVGRSFGRWLLFIVDGLGGGIVGFVFMLTSRRHRRLGDLCAGTYVVRADSMGYPPTLDEVQNTAIVPPAPGMWAPEPPPWTPPAAPGSAPAPPGPPPPPRGPGSPPPWTPG